RVRSLIRNGTPGSNRCRTNSANSSRVPWAKAHSPLPQHKLPDRTGTGISIMKRPSILSLVIAIMVTPALAWADDVMVVYDASDSMWGQIDGVTKIEIARDVMAGLVETGDDDTNIGLIAYGHRREGACADIETLIEPAPISRASFLATVNGINPGGCTP